MFCFPPSEELTSSIYMKMYINMELFWKYVNIFLRERELLHKEQREI